MSNLRRLLKETGVTKEHVINTTKIHRNRFYIGLDNITVFTSDDLKAIAAALRVSVKQLKG